MKTKMLMIGMMFVAITGANHAFADQEVPGWVKLRTICNDLTTQNVNSGKACSLQLAISEEKFNAYKQNRSQQNLDAYNDASKIVLSCISDLSQSCYEAFSDHFQD